MTVTFIEIIFHMASSQELTELILFFFDKNKIFSAFISKTYFNSTHISKTQSLVFEIITMVTDAKHLGERGETDSRSECLNYMMSNIPLWKNLINFKFFIFHQILGISIGIPCILPYFTL